MSVFFDLAAEYRPWLHILLHFFVPVFAVWLLTHASWLAFTHDRAMQGMRAWFVAKGAVSAYLLMMLTMAVDLDHLLAVPLYAPNRCSIGFHPLHQLPAIVVYGLMVIMPLLLAKPLSNAGKVVFWLGLGLVVHMMLDAHDCWWMGL